MDGVEKVGDTIERVWEWRDVKITARCEDKLKGVKIN
jgi:hypothetical protein